jgi:TolB-like protein/Flp pilus assembly protein TadD
MAIWSVEIKEIEKLYESLKGQLPDLEKELERLVKADDENMILLYSRRCLEVIITDLCECELKRERGTEPLKGIIDKLNKERKVPSHIITSMHGLNELSTYGAHPKDFDPEQVKPVLNNLDIIIKWYLKYKVTDSDIKVKPTKEIKHGIKSTGDVKKDITISRKRLAGILGGSIGVIASVFAVLYFSNIIGRYIQPGELDKSIAVLPFISLSDDPEKQYLADGMMDAILLHLSKIEDLRVMSRTSVEQYRKTDKTLSIIGKELDVSYLLEGSFQKYGDNARLIVQLIKSGKEGHVWANEYDRNWNNIFSVQSEVAQAVARELHALITPEEKLLIEKTPTLNLTAYDFYQRGKEEHSKYSQNNRGALEKATNLYKKALEYDSTLAQAYIGLARVYWNKHYWSEFFSETFMDSVIILADISLSFDDTMAEAYTLKGECYRAIGKREEAIKEYDKAIKFNPNDWIAYRGKGLLYLNDDFIIQIDNLQKAAFRNHGNELPGLLRNLWWAYVCVGFTEKSLYYLQEALKLDDDSLSYYSSLLRSEFFNGNYREAIELAEKAYKINPKNIDVLNGLGALNMFSGNNEESLKYYKKWFERLKAGGNIDIDDMHRIGYAYWINGYKEEAEYYFDKQIEYCNSMNKLGRLSAQRFFTYYNLASVYAFRRERDKAYENLRIFNQKKGMPAWMVWLINNDPLFNSLRNEPEFQQIVKDIEAKYQAEHKRVRKWLDENNML